MKGLQKIIRQCAQSTNYTGVVQVSGIMETDCTLSFGYRDRANSIPNGEDTLFGIASGTKLCTALGISRLIESGKLELSTEVREIDRRYTGFISSKATIAHLLSHSSGMYDYYDEELIDESENFEMAIAPQKLDGPQDYLPMFLPHTMKFEPGFRFSYSNGGYVLLAQIIEIVSQQKYRNFIRDEVLKPAGMLRSGFFATNDLPAGTATGYIDTGNQSNIFILPIRGGGDGGMYSCAGDISALWKALFAGKIINSDLLSEFTQTRHLLNDDPMYGYGYGIYKRTDESMYWFEGYDAGVGFRSACFTNADIIITLLSNETGGHIACYRQLVQELQGYIS